MITAFNLWGQFQDRRLEFQFRKYFWSKEQRLIQIGFVLISVLALIRFLSDYILLHSPIKDIIAVRLIIAGLSLFFAGYLGKMNNPWQVDRAISVWWLCFFILLLSTVLRLPELPSTNILFYITVSVPILVAYLYLPNPLPYRIVFALLFSLSYLIGVIRFQPGVDQVVAAILIFSCNHLLGGYKGWQIERLRRELYAGSVIDPLTQAFNRNYFFAVSQQEIERCRCHGWSLCLLAFDLDRFKSINDTYGHNTGDEVLQMFTRISKEHSRAEDLFVRVGGEEFALLLPNTDMDEAEKVAERIRSVLAKTMMITQDPQVQVTTSVGVAQWQEEDQSIDETLKRADAAMYQAKVKGRDRVEVSV